MSAAPGANNTADKVTLAVVSHQIVTLTMLQKEQHKEVMDEIRTIKTNIHALDNEQCIQAEKITNIQVDIRDNIKKDIEENIHPELKRLSRLEWAIGALGIVGSTIAGWLGVKN